MNYNIPDTARSYSFGYNKGHSEGYQGGFCKGWSEGYDIGYHDGCTYINTFGGGSTGLHSFAETQRNLTHCVARHLCNELGRPDDVSTIQECLRKALQSSGCVLDLIGRQCTDLLSQVDKAGQHKCEHSGQHLNYPEVFLDLDSLAQRHGAEYFAEALLAYTNPNN